MLKFDPPQLESDLRKTLAQLTDELTVRFEDSELEPDFQLDDFEGEEWTQSVKLTLSFPRTDTDAALSIGDLIELSEEVVNPKTSFDGLIYHSDIRTVLRVTSSDMRSMSFAEKLTED